MRGRLFCWFGLWVVLVFVEGPSAGGSIHSQALRFDLYDNYLIVVGGSAGRWRGLHFLVDTGASPSVLDRGLARALHLEPRPAEVAVLNGTAPAGRTVMPSLEIGPIRRENFDVGIEDLGFIQKFLPVHIDAIIGLDVLGQSPFEIDYSSREIRFGFIPLRGVFLPLRIKAGLPVVEAELNHSLVKLMLDTGAPSLVLFQSRTPGPVSPMRVDSPQQSVQRIGEVDRRVVEGAALSLGHAEFGKQLVLMAPSRTDEFQDDFDGLISPAALGMQKVAIDLDRGVVAFCR